MSRVTAVVANPMAAAGRVGRDRDALRARIRAALGDHRWMETSRQGDGARCAREAVDAGATCVLSLGGDGTHHEVVNGVMERGDAEHVTLGIVPVGTGGDLGRTLGLRTLDDALDAVCGGVTRRVDVGHATFIDDDGAERHRWFINLASCGISGLVDRKVNASSKRLGGAASFALGTLRALREYVPARVRVTADGRSLGEYTIALVVAGNGRYAGGGMCFCPHAVLDDGLLDVLIVPHRSVRDALRGLGALYTGSIDRVAGVVTARATHVEIEALDGVALLDVDGEAPGRATASFRAHRERITVAVPGDFDAHGPRHG